MSRRKSSQPEQGQAQTGGGQAPTGGGQAPTGGGLAQSAGGLARVGHWLTRMGLSQHHSVLEPMALRHMGPIFKRELWGYFRSPVAYVFIVVFLTATTGTTWFLGDFFSSNNASLEVFFFFHPWLYLFLVPAVGMRLWAEERRSGSIELLLTLPVSLLTAVTAKFLAAWLFVGAALALTFPMIISVYVLGSPDFGVIVTGYLGSFLMAGAYLSVASFTSSITKNQVISFILSFMACLVLVLLGWGVMAESLERLFPVWLSDFITGFSFTPHFDAMRRGVVDIRDLVYFLSFTGFMLLATVIALDNRKAN